MSDLLPEIKDSKAATALYEALEKILRNFNWLDPEPDDTPLLVQARAALTLARGEKP